MASDIGQRADCRAGELLKELARATPATAAVQGGLANAAVSAGIKWQELEKSAYATAIEDAGNLNGPYRVVLGRSSRRIHCQKPVIEISLPVVSSLLGVAGPAAPNCQGQ